MRVLQNGGGISRLTLQIIMRNVRRPMVYHHDSMEALSIGAHGDRCGWRYGWLRSAFGSRSVDKQNGPAVLIQSRAIW